MIQTESTSNITGANIYGGSGIAERLMFYGTEGKFANLTEMIEKGYMPNFGSYLEENPEVKSAITAYDGNIIMSYCRAECIARTFNIRKSWVTDLLDVENAAYDTNDFVTYYEGYYIGENKRTGENGGTVTPKEGVDIVKKTDQSIIEIQNNLDVKIGKLLQKHLFSTLRIIMIMKRHLNCF